eukprot:7203645-Karenia_brevis.AAC.1
MMVTFIDDDNDEDYYAHGIISIPNQAKPTTLSQSLTEFWDQLPKTKSLSAVVALMLHIRLLARVSEKILKRPWSARHVLYKLTLWNRISMLLARQRHEESARSAR